MIIYRLSHCIFIEAVVQTVAVRFRRAIVTLAYFAAVGGALLLVGCDKATSSSESAGPSQTSQPVSSQQGDNGNGSNGNGGMSCPGSGTSASYNIFVRGDYVGTGTATVSTSSVQITAQVTDSTGNTGTLTASAPVVNQRFAGTGTAINRSITFNGRVDPADASAAPGSVLRSQRLVGTFSTTDSHFGRIAGQPGGG
jgi:hypothetical protein